MRLINAKTLQIEDFTLKEKPPYAILSHTWGSDEVTYQAFCTGGKLSGNGYDKIVGSCRMAIAWALPYVWVDTCCIDKTNSAELSEAINSMFRWYRDSAVCFAYLFDLTSENQQELFASRWWTRGWTLQELIAPANLLFFNREWRQVGAKEMLASEIESKKGYPCVTDTAQLSKYSVAERMSWAAERSTTRLEDEAYCLLGIFGINMPLIYGEGRNAFRRLQEEIIRNTSELSILSFQYEKQNPYRLLAQRPSQFVPNTSMKQVTESPGEFTLTNRGLAITNARLYFARNLYNHGSVIHSYLLEIDEDARLTLPLKKIGAATFMRHPNYLDMPFYLNKRLSPDSEESSKIYIVLDLPRYECSHVFRLFLPDVHSMSCSPTSARDYETNSMILGIATNRHLLNRVLAFKLRHRNGERLMLYTYVAFQTHNELLKVLFTLADYGQGFSDFLFDDSRSEWSVTLDRFLEMVRSPDTEKTLLSNWRSASPTLLGGPLIPLEFENTTSKISHEFKLKSGSWQVSFDAHTDNKADRITKLQLAIDKVKSK